MPYTLSPWSLNDLFPSVDSPELEAAFEKIEEQVTSFEGVRNKLKADISEQDFLEILRASEETTRLAYKLYAFAGLSFAAETQNQIAQTL